MKFDFFKKLSKKTWVIIGSAAAVLLILVQTLSVAFAMPNGGEGLHGRHINHAGTGMDMLAYTESDIVLDLSAADPSAGGIGWTYNDASKAYNITGTDITVTGSNIDGRHIDVNTSGTLNMTLKNASITGLADGAAGIYIGDNAILDLTLTGVNSVTGGNNCAGIQMSSSASLIVSGAGSLTATGGSGGAGIGGGLRGAGENITINGGGAIAGIVIGAVLILALAGFGIFWFAIKKKNFADIAALFRKKP